MEVRGLRRNPEYQRGAAWSLPQKQALIDSAFRVYPLRPLFLEKIVSLGGLSGGASTKFAVVDGQQRLLATKPVTLVAMLKQRGKAARLTFPLSPHVLRHTCATHLLQGGADGRHV